MKFTLSFCVIEQLSEDIFEVTINEGAVIDEHCVAEAEAFWQRIRQTPYRLLVNNTNRFSYSFLGAKEIGNHPLEQRTAVLVGDLATEEQMNTVRSLKTVAGNWDNRRVFHDREEAMQWLEQS